MKLWEVVSAFRDDPESLAAVMNSNRWREPYARHLRDWARLVDMQCRDVLDSFVPLEFSGEIASRCKRRFFYNPQTRRLRADHHAAGKIEMTALEVHDRFGGSVIEEVQEKGSWQAPAIVA